MSCSDCLSLSLSTGNSLQMRSPGAVSLNAAKSPDIEVKSTVTDPGQSHLSTVAIPNLEPGGVGDIGLWDVSSGKKLLSRNFRVLNLDAGPMALKSPDGSIFGENVLVLKWYGVADFHFL
ncbi:unnamed protein product [Prunus armeniaca]